MLVDYKFGLGESLKVNWPCWIFSTSINSKGKVFGLHDQDYMHNPCGPFNSYVNEQCGYLANNVAHADNYVCCNVDNANIDKC